VKIVDYDKATGIGDRSSSTYIGGKCSGASFNSTGATKFGEGTQHFVVTNGGNRIDYFPTRNVPFVSPTNHATFLGDFLVSGTLLTQTLQVGMLIGSFLLNFQGFMA